jgi:hypothetical protein
MKYIFLIGAEHQLYQVDFAISHFNVDLEDVILLVQDMESDNRLINKLVQTRTFNEIYSFPNWTFSDVICFDSKPGFFIELCKKLKHENRFITLFSSHYSDDSTLLFLSILKPSVFFLMDEGTASFTVLERRRMSDASFRFKLIVKSFFYNLLLRRPKKIVYFTRFNFIPDSPDEVELYNIAKIANEIIFFNSQFAFLGSSVVELGIMDVKDYLVFLNKVKIDNFGVELLYYKHRKEEDAKLSMIEQLGFLVIDVGCPFENYFASQTTVPRRIGSFFTTSALINISDNFQNMPELTMYVFSTKKLVRNKKVFDNILKLVQKNKIINFIYLPE